MVKDVAVRFSIAYRATLDGAQQHADALLPACRYGWHTLRHALEFLGCRARDIRRSQYVEDIDDTNILPTRHTCTEYVT